MNSEHILLDIPHHQRDRAQEIVSRVHWESLIADVGCHTSALTLLGIINDRLLPQLSRDCPRARTIQKLLEIALPEILAVQNVNHLAKIFGKEAIGIVRELVLPKVNATSRTAALILAIFLDQSERQLRHSCRSKSKCKSWTVNPTGYRRCACAQSPR